MSTDLTGKVLDDRYRVIEAVGSGAMGHVYKAERVKLGRIVAVKVMNDALQDGNARQRFEREAMAMAKLEHPHCASVVDVGVHGDQPYVVMEFVTGKNLKQVLEAGPLPVQRAVDITRQILSGLAHAHEHGVIHRDIKPANIVLSQKSGLGDQVKILDFGLARFNKEASNLTSGMVLGTPNYMAPEQIKGMTLDHRIDLYACGVVLFELLTGRKPFISDSNDPVQICMMHINAPVPRLADAAPGKDFGALEQVVAKALVKDREQRYASAEEMTKALADAVARPTPLPIPVTPPPTPLNATMPLDSDIAAEPSVTNVAAAPAPRVTAPTVAAKPAAAPAGNRRTLAMIVGGVAVVTAIGVGFAMRGDDKPAPAAAPGPSEPVAPAPKPKTEEPAKTDAVEELIAEAKSQSRERALDTLLAARKTYPKDARIAYEAAKLYLDKMWWADGLKLARTAIELDDKYRSDPDLIKLVVKGYNTTKSVDYTLASFLRKDIGAPAKPYLEDTAKGHPNPIVRKRAQRELANF